MKLLALAVPALASFGVPVTVQGWNMGRPFTPMLLQMSPASIMLDRQRSLAQRMFDQTGFSSPQYELVDNDTKFQLSVDVPGVKEEDIDIQLDDGFLTVKGQRMATSESSRFSSRFSQTFSLDPSVDVEQFTASLSNGVLTVSAPKDVKKLEESIRRIPIEVGASPGKEEIPTAVEAESNETPIVETKEEKLEENDLEEIDLDSET